MSDPTDAPPVPLRDVQALADLALDPDAARATEDRARRTIAAALAAPSTARSDAERRRRFRVSRHFSRRGLALIAGGAVLVGGTAIAATTPWSPQLGDDHRGHPTVSTRPVPIDQLAALAVLRRAQTMADRSPEVERVLKIMPRRVIGGLHLDSVRLLADRSDGITVLLAASRVGSNDPGAPPGRLRDQLCLLRSFKYSWRNGRRLPMPSTGMNCGTTADLAYGRMMSGAQWGGRIGVGGLLPDGVIRVEVPLTDGPTLRAEVVNNTFLIDAATPVGRYNRNNIRWLDARGKNVRPGAK